MPKMILMTTFTKSCRDEKRDKRKINAFRRKLMIPDSDITECQNTKSNQK